MDINIGRYNIRNGRNGGIELVLRAIVQANMELGILFEMNLTAGVYMSRSLGYSVLASEAPSKDQGVIVIFFYDPPH